MKTIEERAILATIKDTSKGRSRKDYFIYSTDDHENGFREGYIQGATEQREIDIDKACKALDNVYFASEDAREKAKTIIRKAMEA